jgi:hypothetical protein
MPSPLIAGKLASYLPGKTGVRMKRNRLSSISMNIKMREISNKDIQIILDHLPKTIRCGKHSGFPHCCIRYFLTVHMWRTDLAKRRYVQKLSRLPIWAGYIPCPQCVKGLNFVKVKKCPKGNHCKHSAEHPDWKRSGR